MTQPVIRELRVTDIRCRARGCGAAPGENCNVGAVGMYAYIGGVPVHVWRINDHMELVDAGWQWQEVDPRDDGADRDKRSRG